MEALFSIQPLLFAVFRDADGSIHWSEYDGKKVRAAFPSADGDRCIVLLDYEASRKARFENLFCVDTSGKTIWTAELPHADYHDSFVEAEMAQDGLHAWSWSCYFTVFDPADGRIINRKFVK